MIRRFPHLRFLTALLVAGTVAGGAYAYTAANTVPTSAAGAGSGVVSGFAVTNVHYGLNTVTPLNVDALSFNVSPVIPSTGSGKVVVQVSLSTGGPSTYTCLTNTVGDTVTCATTSPQLAADKLTGVTVVAAQ